MTFSESIKQTFSGLKLEGQWARTVLESNANKRM
jgi:hypothetical protein